DLDGQGNLSGGLSKDHNFKGYLPNYFSHPEDEHDLISVRSENLHFIANERQRSIGAAKLLSSQGRNGQERLRDILVPLKEYYDVILVDCPPTYDILAENAMIASDRILIPTELTMEALDGMVALIREIMKVKEKGWNKNVEVSGIIIFRPNERTVYQAEAKKELVKIAGDKLFSTTIRENVKVAESIAMGLSVMEHAPKSNGSEDILSLTDELIKTESLTIQSNGKAR
ncbi:MAG: ParA family protein, partial [Bacteroidales bacterium]|nr:ParA family protein [Bacteroidales bacterium]